MEMKLISERKPDGYCILSAKHLQELEYFVNEKIREGWTPQGSGYTASYPTNIERAPQIVFYQPMVRKG
jgi:hypothetical protein